MLHFRRVLLLLALVVVLAVALVAALVVALVLVPVVELVVPVAWQFVRVVPLLVVVVVE